MSIYYREWCQKGLLHPKELNHLRFKEYYIDLDKTIGFVKFYN
jgi:hypothetical protein